MARVALVQLAPRFGDVAANLATVDRLLDEAGPVDLAVLPETALTGYVSPAGDFDLRRFSELVPGPTTQALAALARKHRCAVAGPVIERVGRAHYNACHAVDAGGCAVLHYRKRHPWYPETWATASRDAPPLLDVAGLRISVAICFDVHFLAEDAADALRAADLLLFPSAWVEASAGDDSRAELLPDVARRYGTAIANANWAAGTPHVPGQGGSMFVTPDGEVSARAGLADEVLVAEAWPRSGPE